VSGGAVGHPRGKNPKPDKSTKTDYANKIDWFSEAGGELIYIGKVRQGGKRGKKGGCDERTLSRSV